MSDAGRGTVLPKPDPEPSRLDALAAAYLAEAEGDAAEALRLALANAMVEQAHLCGRIESLQRLVSVGYAKWGGRRD
jgi:hypothetical protein